MTKNKFINLCLKSRPNTSEMTFETVLVFGLESVSYERSQRAKHAKMQHFSARVFFPITPLCQNSRICAMSGFSWMLTLKNVLVQVCT